MVQNALEVEPPLGLIRAFAPTTTPRIKGTLDLKTRGTRLFVDARACSRWRFGIRETGTAARLRAAGAAARRSAARGCDDRGVPLPAAAAPAAAGAAAVQGNPNRLDPYALHEIDQRMLKEAFRQARKLQERLAQTYGPDDAAAGEPFRSARCLFRAPRVGGALRDRLSAWQRLPRADSRCRIGRRAMWSSTGDDRTRLAPRLPIAIGAVGDVAGASRSATLIRSCCGRRGERQCEHPDPRHRRADAARRSRSGARDARVSRVRGKIAARRVPRRVRPGHARTRVAEILGVALAPAVHRSRVPAARAVSRHRMRQSRRLARAFRHRGRAARPVADAYATAQLTLVALRRPRMRSAWRAPRASSRCRRRSDG